MLWTFRILATLNGVLLLIAFFYKSSGEDPAGTGMRLGFAFFFAIAFAAVLLIYHFGKAPWVRVPMLALLILPLLSIVYGVSLSL